MRIGIPVCTVLLAAASAFPTTALPPQRPNNVSRLAALIDYVAADYRGAVRNGKVIAAAEFDEQKTMLAEAQQLAGEVVSLTGHEHARGELARELGTLQTDFLARATPERISADGLAIHRRLIDDYGLVLTPLIPPDLDRARTLYRSNCAACHGVRGDANTVQARRLKPPPLSFLQPDRMMPVSPTLAFQAITFGVANTSMASFETMAASDRWSLAFYVVSLRHSHAVASRGAAIVERSGLPIAASISRLAELSDSRLDEVLRASEHRAPDRRAVISYLRRIATFAAEPGGAFVEARHLLADVGKAAGDVDRARELALVAYLEGIEPHEAQLKDHDPTLAHRLEAAFRELRDLIDKRPGSEAIRDQVGRTLMLLDRVEERAASAHANAPALRRAKSNQAPSQVQRSGSDSANDDPRMVGAACGGDQPGFSSGPYLRRSPGMPRFDVFKNCLWPKSAGLAIAVSLRAAPPSRERVASLINDLWRQARTTMGKEFPRLCQICAFPAGTTIWSSNWLACAKAGFEPPGEELIELGPEVENRTPYSLAEEAARLAQDRAGLFPGRHRPRVTVDEVRREVEVVFPYLERGQDQWVGHLTYADAAAPFFSLAGDFYSSSAPEPKSLRFVGIWKGRRMLRVHLTGEGSFRSLQQWPMLEKLHRADLPSHSSARTREQEATVRSAYEESLGKLPPESVWVHPLLQATDVGS